MSPSVTQSDRGAQLLSSLGDKLLLRAFNGEDRLGRLFEYQLDMLSEHMNISFDEIVGKSVTVSMEMLDGTRYFNGYVTDFSFVGTEGRMALYTATMKPWLWFLSRTADCRVFQDMSVPDIIKQVFSDNGLSDYEVRLDGHYEPRTYCVQYRETDLDFISRLMEQEGIYYFFDHEEEKHTMVLVDSMSAHPSFDGCETVPYFPPDENEALRAADHLQEWSVRQTIVPTQFAKGDFDFEKPKVDLTSKSELSFGHDYPITESEIYDYPGGYIEKGDGDAYVRKTAETWKAQHERAYAAGNARGMHVGYTFELTDYPREDQNRNYLIITARHAIRNDAMISGGGGNEEFYHCELEVMGSRLPYRSEPTTPRPIVRGPQTAIVVGPSGEEIWCDEHSRVKVQFHWDRYGQLDQNSSCWIRVSQLWAGSDWGGIHIPRIGQEVLVSFLEGDPDQPLITGGVYNADHKPPYALPANQTQSGIKSHSSKEGSKDNFNELRFEDKKGGEEVYLQAEKDCNVLIKNRETRKVGGTRETIIGYPDAKGEDAPKISDDAWTETVYGGKKIEVKGKERFDIATESLDKVGRKVTIKNGDEDLEVSLGDISRKAVAGKITDEALTSIELKVGASSILIDNKGVTIKGLTISIEGNAKTSVTAPMVEVEGKAIATLKGLLTNVESSTITQVKGTLVKIN